MVNWKSKKLGDILVLANGLVIIVLINLIATTFFFRIDLTEEKRYSIKNQTKDILQNLDDEVYIEVFLEGDLNGPFTRFQKSIRETLEEFRIYSNNKVHYIFTDPSGASGQKARSEFMNDLAARGIQPTNVIDTKDGQRVEKIIFPGAIVSVGGFESGVMLLRGSKARTSEEQINQSIEGVEYELIQTIHKITALDRKQIGFVKGHGELDSLELASLSHELSEMYDVLSVNLNSATPLDRYDALIIAKPTTAYSPLEKFTLDQFIMKGGRVMFLLDKLDAVMDSASRQDYFAIPYDLNLDDQLFKYGVRINLDLIQDRHSGLYPIVTGQAGGKPQMQLMEWPFFPLINHYADHPVTRNLDATLTRFVSSMDTVKAEGIQKTPLLFTSAYTRTITAPVNVSVNELRRAMRDEDFSKGQFPIGYLLEGKFSSLYKNRFAPEGASGVAVIPDGVDTKIIVIADGDVARNEVNPRTGQPQVLGFDPFTNYTFANRDFIMNAIAFLVNEGGLIQVRSKEVRIRPLDKTRVKNERMKWQVINLIIPVLVLVIFGIIRASWRKRKYAKF
ncbi:MAG TPA: gliding motility-associated ABC transporter substrate-binding protein GldG [Ohtaekwangia sp.]